MPNFKIIPITVELEPEKMVEKPKEEIKGG